MSTKDKLISKLTSRKFWISVATFVLGAALAFGVTESEITNIVGMITSLVSAVTYTVSEAVVDAKAATGNKEQ